jgi:hypothetical protein
MAPLSPQNTLIGSNFENDDELEDELEFNNNVRPASKPKLNHFTNDESMSSRSFIIKYYSNNKVRYIYTTVGSGIVLRNVFLFFMLHLIYIYSYYVCFANKCWYTWIFSEYLFS